MLSEVIVLAEKDVEILTPEVLELAGRRPVRASHIEDTMKSVGYLGLMINTDEFYQAAIWSSNMIERYESRLKEIGEHRVAVPIEELGGFNKTLLANAYLLLIVYYHRKGNAQLVELLQKRLMGIAKFQEMPEGHRPIMAAWDEYVATMRRNMKLGDYSAPDMSEIEGTRHIYDHYKTLIEKERSRYRDELSKESGSEQNTKDGKKRP